MPNVVDFKTVSTVGVASSPVAAALAGLRANEARYFKNKYNHDFTVESADDAKETVDRVHRILREERGLVIASRALEATDALAVQYVRRQRAAQAQAARAAAPSKAQEVRSTSGGDEDRVAAAGLGAAHGWELEGDPGGRGASEELSAEEADAIKALADSLIAIGGE